MRWKNNNRGSSTVEAAFIFPLILFVILAFLLLSMYLYDAAKLRLDTRNISGYAEALVSLQRAERGFQGPLYGYSNTQSETEKYGIKMLEKGYLVSEFSQLQVDISGGKIITLAKLKNNMSRFGSGLGLLERFSVLTFRDEKEVCECAEKARLYTRMIETGEEIYSLKNAAETLGGLLQK